MTFREEIRKSIEPNAKTLYDETIIVDKVLKLFEKVISSTEEEIKKHICDDEDGLIDYGVGKVADKLREELEK